MQAWLALLLLLAVAAPTASQRSSLVMIRVTTETYDGAIVSAKDRDGKPISETMWTPSESLVTEFERALPAYVAARFKNTRYENALPLTKYKRQYVGITRSETKLLNVTFFREDTDLVANGTWLEAMITVNGGGDRFLRAWYDPGAHKVVEFWINGPK